jgi:membrane associated rhomboid family serine protease
MLSDRLYMREPETRGKVSVLTWLICAITAGFILQNALLRWLQLGHSMEWMFGLSPAALHAGRVWTLVTYSFLHSPENLLHIVCNLLALYFIGRELLPLLGSKRFLFLYAGAVVIGGAVWSAVHWHTGDTLIGASAGVMGLLVVFACFYPNQQMTFLLFFIVPVTLKPKYLALGVAIADLFGFIFYEILGRASPIDLAPSAHLGGMAAGWLYFRFVHDADWQMHHDRVSVELPRWMTRRQRAASAAQPAQAHPGSRGEFRAEVDRILDKINSQGFGALTAEEKRVLDEARELLGKR